MKHVDLIKLMISSLRIKPEVVSVPVSHQAFDRSVQKQCYNNSFLYVMEQMGRLYVLGYVVLDIGVPIEHAWVKSNETYLDVTLAPKDGYEYYPLVEMDFQEVSKFVCERGYAPSLYDYNRFIFKE